MQMTTGIIKSAWTSNEYFQPIVAINHALTMYPNIIPIGAVSISKVSIIVFYLSSFPNRSAQTGK